MKKSIVWLASYPKSGNTWSRIFLANYLMDRETPLPINEVRRFGTGDAITQAYQKVAKRPIDPTDWKLIVALRPQVLKAIVANNADVNVVKTHNIRTEVNGVPLIPPQLTRAAVYVMRNPLDMVLSYARHFDKTHEDAAIAIGRSDNAAIGDAGAVTQFLGSWSEHVTSWTNAAPFPTVVLRYEDMLSAPEETFGNLLTHLGVPIDAERLQRAIRFSSFDEVSRQEAETGFGEKTAVADRFFGKGTSGHWQDELDPAIVKRIKRDHKRVMKKYGYWND